jgi:hypothetical protein
MNTWTICGFLFFNSLSDPSMPSKGDKTGNRVLQSDESFTGKHVGQDRVEIGS